MLILGNELIKTAVDILAWLKSRITAKMHLHNNTMSEPQMAIFKGYQISDCT